MSALTWKPLVLRTIATAADAADAVEQEPSADAFVQYQWGLAQGFCDSISGSEATDEFTLADLEPGVSVIAGTTTSGYWAYGVVMGWVPGKYFTYDGPQVGSLLWRDFLLLRGPIAEAAQARYQERYGPREEGADSPRVPLQRTDSGTSYGFTGRPDPAFWIRSGVEPFLFVTPRHYNGHGLVTEYQRGQIAQELRDLRAALAAPEDMSAEEIRACRHQEAVTAAELAAMEARLGGAAVAVE